MVLPEALCIYHTKCYDGIAAAYALYYFYRGSHEKIEFLPLDFNDDLPDGEGRVVYIVDLNFTQEKIEKLAESAERVIILDHHRTGRDVLMLYPHPDTGERITSIYDESRSGAMIAWDYVLPQNHTTTHPHHPWFIKHVQDRDLWKFELPYTKEIMIALGQHEWTFEFLDDVTLYRSDQVDAVIMEGFKALKKRQRELDDIMELTLRRMTIGEYDVPVVMALPKHASDLGNILSRDEPFAATYWDTAEYRQFSIRSNKEFSGWVEVNKIAEGYGGGGHQHAAGFKVPRDHPLAQT